MKRIIAMVLATLMTLSGGAAMAEAIPEPAGGGGVGYCGNDDITWSFDDGTLRFTGHGPMADYYYYTYLPWRQYIDDIRRIEVGEGITTLGVATTMCLPNLREVVLPSTLTELRSKAYFQSVFMGCYGLERINIPAGVKSLECIDMNSLTQPDTNVSFDVDPRNLWYCSEDGILFDKGKTKLIHYPSKLPSESYTVPATVTRICENAFRYASLMSVSLPAGLKYIGREAFSGCERLEAAALPDGLIEIGDRAFYGCVSLKSASVPTGTIGYQAFCGCAALETVTLPNDLEALESSVFEDCSSLKAVSLPDGLQRIGTWCFAGCESLEGFDIPDAVVMLGHNSFRGCKSLKSVVVPDSVVSMGGGNFEDCAGLESVTLPAGLETLGDNMFSDCSSLKAVTIPDGVKIIANMVFSGCSSLTSVVVPDGVEKMYTGVFRDCSKLADVYLPDSLVSMAGDIFDGCPNVTVHASLGSRGALYAEETGVRFAAE